MKLHTRLILFLAVEISALLHQSVSRVLSYRTESLHQRSQDSLLPRDDLLLPIYPRNQFDTSRASPLSNSPPTRYPFRLQRRGSCLSQACKENHHQAQPQLQRTTNPRTPSVSGESRPRDPVPNELARPGSRSSVHSSPSRPIESSSSTINQASSSSRDQVGPYRLPPSTGGRQPPRYPSDRYGRSLPTDDFGTRLRREMAKKHLVKSAVDTGPGRMTPPSSQRQSIDNGSRKSSLGAESIAPKSGGSSGSKS